MPAVRTSSGLNQAALQMLRESVLSMRLLSAVSGYMTLSPFTNAARAGLMTPRMACG